MMATDVVPVTVEVLTKALQNTAAPWYSSGPVLALYGVVVGALIGFGGNWYLKRMDREAWLEQKSWDLKWQCYSQLAQHFGDIHAGLVSLAQTSENRPEVIQKILVEPFDNFRRYESIARLVIPPSVRVVLEDMTVSFQHAFEIFNNRPARQAEAEEERKTLEGILKHARARLVA